MYQPIQGNKKNIKNLTANNLELNANNTNRNSKAATIKNALQKKNNENLKAKMNSNPTPGSLGKSSTTNNIKSNDSTSTNKQNIKSMIQQYKILTYPSNITSINNMNISKSLNKLKQSNIFYKTRINQLTETITQVNKNKSNTSQKYKNLKSKTTKTDNNQNNMENLGLLSQTYDGQIKKLTRIQNTLNTKYTNFQENYKKAISTYLQSTFIDQITQKKTKLNGLLAALVIINKTLTTTLGNEKELTNNTIKNITNAYQKFTNSRKQINNNLQNKSLRTQFNTLQTNLGTLGVNVTNTNKAFKNFNNTFAKQVTNKLATNKKSVNSAFQSRINKINTSIKQKTDALKPIVDKITSQLKELEDLTGNTKNLNNAIKVPLNKLIVQMNETITTMNGETEQQQLQLTKMVGSLKNIIGQPMNSVPRTLSNTTPVPPSTNLVVRPSQNMMVLKSVPVNVQKNAASIDLNLNTITKTQFNKIYKQLALKFSPNKGGTKQNFQALQTVKGYFDSQNKNNSNNSTKLITTNNPNNALQGHVLGERSAASSTQKPVVSSSNKQSTVGTPKNKKKTPSNIQITYIERVASTNKLSDGKKKTANQLRKKPNVSLKNLSNNTIKSIYNKKYENYKPK